jgi:hypothetical protein
MGKDIDVEADFTVSCGRTGVEIEEEGGDTRMVGESKYRTPNIPSENRVGCSSTIIALHRSALQKQAKAEYLDANGDADTFFATTITFPDPGPSTLTCTNGESYA